MTNEEKEIILRLCGWYKEERKFTDDSGYEWVHDDKMPYIFTLLSAWEEHNEVGYDK